MFLNEPQTKEINCAITQPTSVSRKYNSTHAGLLADIFGDDPRFARYDVLHTEIKSKQGMVSMSHYKEYKDILAELQSKLLVEKSVALQQLNAIHTDNEASDCLPINNGNETHLLNKYKKIKVLLRSWKLNV